MITQEELKSMIHYDSESGEFTWIYRRGPARAGSSAGWVDNAGYRRIEVCRHRYQAHRLAFLYMTGEMPADQADHIDGNRANNSWINLRAVSGGENMKNMRKYITNSSGITGVCWYKQTKKWVAYIRSVGSLIHLGYFDNLEDAVASRKEAEKHYGFHQNHGRSA